MGKLTPVSTLLHSTEGKPGIRLDEGVYEAQPGLDPPRCDPLTALHVACEDGSAEPEYRIVRYLDGLPPSSRTVMIDATGPKSSSWYAGIPFATSARTVGG